MSENKYTIKTNIPQYEPKTGYDFSKKKIYDLTKFEELVAEIKNTEGLSEQEKDFLIYGATRHIEFDYSVIAEYYCIASPQVQRLMEKSALVIIDIDDAIANGYVQLSKKVEEIINRRKEQ